MANLSSGDPAIPFELPGVDGRTHTLAEYSDKAAVAVVFSCNHCPYVQAWEDRMIQIQKDYADRGFQLLAINSNDPVQYPTDSFPAMKERAAHKGFNFPYLFDESQQVAEQYGAERTPEVFLFDQGGSLRYHGAIDDNYDDPSAVSENYLRDALDAVLEDRTPATLSTPAVGCTIKWKR
jgi:peroxiredoxin